MRTRAGSWARPSSPSSSGRPPRNGSDGRSASTSTSSLTARCTGATWSRTSRSVSWASASAALRSYGNRYYHKPIIASPVRRPKPMTVDWFRFTQSLTDRPVKGMLTGPYTLLDWSYNEAYRTRREAALALAEVVRQEAEDLQAAGAR